MKKNILYLKNYLSISALIVLTGVLIFSSCKKDNTKPNNSGVLMFEGTAKLSNDNVNSNASGSVTGQYDPDTQKLSYTFKWDGLTGTIGGFHIHKGDGSIIIDFHDVANYPTTTSGTFSGESTLTNDTWIQDLKSGKLYGQIHTEKYPGGELIFPFNKKGENGGNTGGGTPPIY